MNIGRIGIDARFVGRTTGIGRYAENLLTHFIGANSDYEFIVFTSSKDNEEAVRRICLNLNRGGGKTVNWNIGNKKVFRSKYFEDQLYLRKAVVDSRIELLYSPYFDLPICLKIPLVVTIHDISLITHKEHYTKKQSVYYGTLIRYFAKKATYIISDTEAGKRDLLEELSCGAEQVVVIKPGISWTGNQRIYLRLEQKLPDDFILYTGGIAPRKNIENLIFAFKELNLLLDKQEFLIITGPSSKYRESLENLTKELGISRYVVFMGLVEEDVLRHLYSKAKLVVYPSLYEGFGFPIVEAMASGVPIVGSNTSCIPEVIGDKELLFNPHDIKEMAAAMKKLLTDNDLREKSIESGLKRVKEYSWQITGERLLELFQEILDSKAIEI